TSSTREIRAHAESTHQTPRAAPRRSAGQALGVPVTTRRLSLTRVREAVQSREQVLLVVSLAAMQGYDVPHWVLCRGAVPGAVVLEDPWFRAAAGETWVDAHLLPVPDASLEAMSLLTEDGARFRGAVRVGRADRTEAVDV
ncbi:peptidase C39 family protein, partial [Streptomyces sp. NPDC003656]